MTQIMWPLAAVMLVQASLMIAAVAVPVLAPELAVDTGIDAKWIGVYSSLVFAGALVSIILGGYLTRRFGAITMSQIALVTAGAALLATASGNVVVITVAAITVGVGYGLATPAASQILANVTQPGHRGVVFSLKQSTVSFGGLIAGLLVPILVVGFGWRTAILCVGLLVITTSLLIHPLRTSQDDRQPPGSPTLVLPWHYISYVLGHPKLRMLALITFTFAAAQNSMNAIFVTYLVTKFQISLVLAGTAFSTMQITGMLTRVVLGWATDRFLSATKLLGIIGLSIAIMFSILALVEGTWSMTVVFVIAAATGVFVGGWSGVSLAEIARVVDQKSVAIATSGTIFFSFLGAAVGPSLFSVLVAQTNSFNPAFLTIAAAAAFVGILVLVTQNRVNKIR